MSNKDLTVYMTIANSAGSVELSAGYDPDDKTYYMTSITFSKEHTLGYDFWDSDNFIFNIFYPFLERYRDKCLTIEDKTTFPLWEALTDEEILDLLDILNLGKELNWDKLAI